MSAGESARAWVSLQLVEGLGSRSLHSLLHAFGSPQAVLDASLPSLRDHVSRPVAEAIVRGGNHELIEQTLSWLDQPNNHLLTWSDSDYPQSLLTIDDPPAVFYYKGRRELLNMPALAIVGSRNATPQGVENAERFAESLSDVGLTIVSGLAAGIDAAAHRGGLRGGAKSIAVVGTGIDRVYPAAHRDLAHELAHDGGIISEFPLTTPPLPGNFPRRNRLISGLSKGCLVVEATLSSGSLITARLAVEQGREVFAIPGSIHSAFSKGCHQLIREGAKLAETAQDILEELRWTNSLTRQKNNAEIPSAEEGELAVVLHALGYDPITVDDLIARTALSAARVCALLLDLELQGRVHAMPGGLYQRVH